MSDKPTIEHIMRRATLPWRPPEHQLTECGKAVTTYASITYDDFVWKLRKQGQQRAAMSTCMTCWNAATRYQPWAIDPVDAVRREVYGMRGDADAFRRELWAIAALIAAHRAEFDGYLHGLDQTADLAARRRVKRLSGR